jgi:hypothetical protein
MLQRTHQTPASSHPGTLPARVSVCGIITIPTIIVAITAGGGP